MRTYIRHYNKDNELEDSIILNDEDATVEAIAQTVIDLVASRMCVRPGDMIEITEG